jgi:hypothetical protein
LEEAEAVGEGDVLEVEGEELEEMLEEEEVGVEEEAEGGRQEKMLPWSKSTDDVISCE